MRFIRGLLGVVGELLISAGVLLLLFTVWQLWWTDVMADREQQEILADLDWVVTIDKDDVAPADDGLQPGEGPPPVPEYPDHHSTDRKSTRLNSSHVARSYAVLCLIKKNRNISLHC